MRCLCAALIAATVLTEAKAEDKGFLNCIREHMNPAQQKEITDWFRSPAVAICCDISDGMATVAEDRDDGIYIPPHDELLQLAWACRDNPQKPFGQPSADHANWVRVDPRTILRTNNPIGIAVVWWWFGSRSSHDGSRPQWRTRCFADLVRG